MVAKKDYHAPKHPELETIPNLQVIKAMQVRQNKMTTSSFVFRYYYRIFLFSISSSTHNASQTLNERSDTHGCEIVWQLLHTAESWPCRCMLTNLYLFRSSR